MIELPGGGYALLGMTHAPVPYDPQGAYRIGVVVHLDENGNKTGEYPVDDGWYPRNYANMYFTADNDVILTGACDPNQMPYRYYCNQRSDIHGNIEWSIMLPWYESARLYKAADKPGGGFFTADNIDNGDGTYSLEVTALDDSANDFALPQCLQPFQPLRPARHRRSRPIK